MLKTFPIEFIRQIFEQTLEQAHIDNPNFFGGKSQIALASFYQQLKNQAEVDRFVEQFRDLTEQQNRLDLIGNGMLLSPENPTVTNLYTCLIIPMTYTCTMRCNLYNRDQMIETINNLIYELKGSKVDIAQLDCIDENGKHYAQPFMVGTLGHNDGQPRLKNGDFIGSISSVGAIGDLIDQVLIEEKGFLPNEDVNGQWYYYIDMDDDLLKVAVYDAGNDIFVNMVDDGTRTDIIFPPEHTSLEKFKVSLSFESLRCDTPNTLNGEKYCEISFGGSATLVNESVRLGNDLVKVGIVKYGYETSSTSVVYSTPTYYWLEPLEMPSGNNASTKPLQLVSKRFLNESHTDGLTITLQYSFVCDLSNHLLEQWFNYGRYGEQNLDSENDYSTMTPNLIYNVKEIWSSWGYVTIKEKKTKLVENVDIENTEGDTLTLGITMQVQGD